MERNVVYAIFSIRNIADKDPGMSAVRFLERIDSNVVSDIAKLSRPLQAIRKICTKEEWPDACRMWVESMGIAILSKDEEPHNYGVEYLTPKGRTNRAGYVSACVYKMKLLSACGRIYDYFYVFVEDVHKRLQKIQNYLYNMKLLSACGRIDFPFYVNL